MRNELALTVVDGNGVVEEACKAIGAKSVATEALGLEFAPLETSTAQGG